MSLEPTGQQSPRLDYCLNQRLFVGLFVPLEGTMSIVQHWFPCCESRMALIVGAFSPGTRHVLPGHEYSYSIRQ